MPVMFGFLVKPNCTVDVEAVAVTQGSDGGTVESFSAVASSVPVFISQFGGGRDKPFGTDAQTDRGTISGDSAHLGRSDVRLKVVTAPTKLAHLVGCYLRVASPTSHAAGSFLVPARDRLEWTRVETPRQITGGG